MPRFPGKKGWKSFWGKFSEQDVEERRVELETYMRHLAQNKTAIGSAYFIDFIQMPAEVADRWRTI